MRTRSLLLNARPARGVSFLLPWVLFVAGVGGYFYAARERHLVNPDERVTPTMTEMLKGMAGAALRPAGDEEDDAAIDGDAGWMTDAGVIENVIDQTARLRAWARARMGDFGFFVLVHYQYRRRISFETAPVRTKLTVD